MFRKLMNLVSFGPARAAVVAAALAAAPAVSFAGHDRDDRHDNRGWRDDRRDWHDDHHDWDHHDWDHHDGHGSIGFEYRTGPAYCPPPAVVCPPPPCEERVWVPAVYRTVSDRRWVEPVYRTVYDHVWVAPVTQCVTDRVWVPDRYEYQDVVTYDHGRRCVSRQQVLVEPGHYVDGPPREVVVAPGHYEDRPRQELVCDGHWESCDRQELVCAAHWETRPVVVAAPPRSEARIDLRFPIHF